MILNCSQLEVNKLVKKMYLFLKEEEQANIKLKQDLKISDMSKLLLNYINIEYYKLRN